MALPVTAGGEIKRLAPVPQNEGARGAGHFDHLPGVQPGEGERRGFECLVVASAQPQARNRIVGLKLIAHGYFLYVIEKTPLGAG